MKKIKFIIVFFFIAFFAITNINSQTTVVIGTSGDYSDMNDFISNIKSYPETDVIAKLEAGTHIEQVIIDSIGHMGFPSSLTIESLGVKSSTTMQAPANLTISNNYIFLIRNSMNVTIRDIDFVNDNTLFSNIISFSHYNDYIDINHCSFANTSSAGVDTNKSIIYFAPSSGSTIIEFVENNFYNGSYSIYSNGAAINLKIDKNVFNEFDFCGIHIVKPNFLTITDNVIVSNKVTGNQRGIEVDVMSPIHIRRNFIGLSGNTTNTGITCVNSDSTIIANNMLSLNGGGTNIALHVSNTYTDVVFNNIYIPYGNNSSTGLKINNCDGMSLIQNNIFDVYVGFVYDFDTPVYSDYNLFNFNPSNDFAKIQAGIITDLIDWQNEQYMDYESILGDPKYISNTNLHTGNQLLVEGKGVFLFGYDKDYDGQIRKNPPDIGADEIQAAIRGTISSNTTWSKSVYIDSTLTINNGVVVTILPGTRISFSDSALINNFGTITAIGKKDSLIIFGYSKYNETKSVPNWKGIKNFNTPTNNFEYCKFTNSLDGALYFDNCGGTNIINCIFFDNNGTNGAAIFSMTTDLFIRNCEFNNNYATNSGGALYLTDVTTVANCIFSYNYADLGADIFLSIDETNIINNTFYDSFSTSGAYSIEAYNSQSTIANSIFWGTYDNVNIIKVSGTNHPVMKNLNVKGSPAYGFYFESAYDTINIYNIDPMFVNSNENNFRLQPSSEMINKGNISYGYATDKDGNPRPFSSGLPDIGAYEFQGTPLFAYAGTDLSICSDTLTLSANNPTPFQGTWSIISGDANFEDIHDPNTKITNLGFSDNYFRWTVSDGIYDVHDDIHIINNKPQAIAFEDIYLISVDFPNLITEAPLSAMTVVPPATGTWTCLDPTVNIISPDNNATMVNNLKRGINTFIWIVDNDGCENTDTLIVSSGFGVIPITQDSVGWNSPGIWNIGEVPGLGDSVNLTGSKVLIDGNAQCGKLFVSSSTKLYIKGTAKSPAVLHTDKIYIEQDPEKKFKAGDAARLIINNGQVFINDATNELTDGLVVGSQGQVIIEPDAGGVAEIHLGKNRQLRVEAQAIFKGATGTGNLTIKNGGKIYIEQDAEKKDSKGYNNNVYVGSGGTIYIEQDAEKKVDENTELVIGKGNRIYIEQDAEKKGYAGGSVVINGGKIYIEQDAEKSNLKGSFFDVNVHRGGTIYIEQDAEKKGSDSSILSVPRILINNGRIFVGSNNSSKANNGVIDGNKIYIEQDAEKGLSNDSALVIYGSGSVKISSTNNIHGNIHLSSNTALTIAPGGSLVFADSSYLSYPNNASIIDYGNNVIPAIETYSFNAFDTLLYSLPFVSIAANTIDSSFSTFSWAENSETFNPIIGSTSINGGSGNLFITKPSPSSQQFSGTLNSGDVSVSLSNTNNGINLIGNPYPSAIDFDKLDLGKDIQSSIYLFNPITNNYEIIQQNGLNMYSENAIIDQNQAFFVITNNNSNFNFVSSSQTHNLTPEPPKDMSLINHLSMSFSTSADFYDAVGLVFKNNASDNYHNQEDAVELEVIQKSNYINSYTYSADNKKLAINTKQMPANKSTISLFFISDMEGSYEFNLVEKVLSAGVEVFLIDPARKDTTNLQLTPYYYFDYNSAGVEKEFLLLFKGNMVKVNEDFAQTNIYSFNNDVYVNTSSQINKVEIYTITGVKIITKNFNSNKAIIRTNLENGVYIVKAHLSDGIETQKIIIN